MKKRRKNGGIIIHFKSGMPDAFLDTLQEIMHELSRFEDYQVTIVFDEIKEDQEDE